MKQTWTTRNIAYMAILIALTVLGNKVLALQLATLRIGFGFLPIMVSGLLLGRDKTIVVAVVADIMGTLFFPSGGAYFFGWTISAAISGYIYGGLNTCDLKYPSLIKRVVIESLIVTTLNSVWLYMIVGKGIYVDLPIRYSKMLFTIPVQVIMGHSVLVPIKKRLGELK